MIMRCSMMYWNLPYWNPRYVFLTHRHSAELFSNGKSKRRLNASIYIILRDVTLINSMSVSGSSRLLLDGKESVWRCTLSPKAPDGSAPWIPRSRGPDDRKVSRGTLSSARSPTLPLSALYLPPQSWQHSSTAHISIARRRKVTNQRLVLFRSEN